MLLNELLTLYARHPQTKALVQQLKNKTERKVTISGFTESSVAMYFAAAQVGVRRCMLFIMRDADEAGYLYQDFSNIIGGADVLLFPSSYKRAVKYGQRDASGEIMRTEVLTALSKSQSLPPVIV